MSKAILYGGNNFGPSGWANGDCWLLDLEKAKKLSNINLDKAHQITNDNMDNAKDTFKYRVDNAKEFIHIDPDMLKRIIDVNLDKARDQINIELEKAKENIDPPSIWTPVSSHTHLPRVNHRDVIFSASHPWKKMLVDKTAHAFF